MRFGQRLSRFGRGSPLSSSPGLATGELLPARARESQVAVVPVYRQHPSSMEAQRLCQSAKFLPDRKVFLAPVGLVMEEYHALVPDARVIFLSPEWFRNHESYSSLMLQPWLYELFQDSEFLVVYQLDAILTRPIDFEALKNFDYVGAPWWPAFRLGWNPVRRVLHPTVKLGLRRSLRVGNGGLSVRRVSAFVRAARRIPTISNRINEDLIFAFFAPLVGLRVATVGVAEKFFMESGARYWSLGDAVPTAAGFHALEKFCPQLEKTVLAKLLGQEDVGT